MLQSESVDIQGKKILLKEHVIQTSEYRDGKWYYNFMGEEKLIQDPLVYGELKWSRNFSNVIKANKGYASGLYDLFLGGASNYWETDISMKRFFGLKNNDAVGQLQALLPDKFTVWTRDNIAMASEVGIKYTDEDGEVQSIII